MRHIFARFAPHGLRLEAQGQMDSANFLYTIDRVCGQFASALQHAGIQLYTSIAVVLVLSALLFPREGGPDQV